MEKLPDGQYDTVISSVRMDNEGFLALELTVRGGEFDGQTVPVRAPKQRFMKEPEELADQAASLTMRYGVADVSLAE
jgi:hypothetical protein